MTFFIPLKFKAFFPPRPASTWARRVVGALINLTPLLKVDAANPTTSEAAPPPIDTTVVPLVALEFSRNS